MLCVGVVDYLNILKPVFVILLQKSAFIRAEGLIPRRLRRNEGY